jgi:hypothetical protein
MKRDRFRRLRWVPLAAATLHAFLFGLTGILYEIQQQPLLNGPARFPFAIVFLADLPVSAVAFGAMFGGQRHALYFLAAWGVLGTLWWYILGLFIQAKASLNR